MSGKQMRTNVRGTGLLSFATKSPAPAAPLIYNYSNDAGRGSGTFAEDAGLNWRRALLGGVAAGAMWAGAPRHAAASAPLCGSSSTYDFITHTLTCVQDQSAGISTYVRNLVVKDLTKDITPAAGIAGIAMDISNTNLVTLNSTFGEHTIKTTGDYAAGIDVYGEYGVTVVHSGDISTSGNNADGIHAYAYYDRATVTSTANIHTTGNGSDGIDVRSGYDGVTLVSVGNITTEGSGAAGIRVVGHNEDSDNGEAVSVTSTGNITTKGDGASGIDARNYDGDTTVASIGTIATGSYSRGIYARASYGGTASVTSTGDITVGNYSVGIIAQSDGGNVAVNSTGNITGGADSSGIVATGGYGFGKPFAKSFGGDISVTSVGNITLTGKNNNHNHGPFGIGSAGILAFGAADITIDSTGNISTTGDSRGGIVAFSYDNFCCGPVKTVTPSGVNIVSVGDITTTGQNSFGIAGVSFGDNVTITSTGDINTSGQNSAGITAYSGNGNTTVTSTGNIKTAGQYSHGIFAGSDDNSVTVTSTGNITASGQDSSGIYVQGDETSTVNIVSGTVSGGTQGGASVAFSGNAEGTLSNSGTITGGGSGWAVTGRYGAETVNNSGTITGNIDLVNGGSDNSKYVKQPSPHSGLAPSNNTFNNLEGSTLNSGETVSLGYGGVLTNDGTLNPGGDGKVQTTSLWGNIVQGAKGLFGVDVDHTAGTSDRINVSDSGGSMTTKAGPSGMATLSGKVAANLLTFDIIKPDKNFTILSAAGGTTHAGLTVADTALVDYSLLYPNANDVVLAMNVSFEASGLTPNQSALVGFFGRGVGAGMPPELEKTYLALLNAKDAAALGAIADQLYSNAGSSAVGAMQGGDALAFAMRSCPVAEGPYGQLRETSCIWAKPTARHFRQDKDTDTADIRDTTVGISGGFQAAIADNVWGGLGVSLENSDSEINTTTKTEGKWWQIGGVAKWTQGAWKLSASISGGQGNIDADRGINIPGVNLVASSGTNIGLVTGLTRLAYSFGASGFYVTPMIDVGFSYIDLDGYTEHGAGALNLIVGSSDEWIASGGAAVEVGSTIVTEALTYRPYVKAGVSFLSEDSFTTSARFVGTPASVASFKINSKFDDVFADISAGIQMFGGQGLNLRLNYDGRFGENSEQHGLDAKLTVNY